MNSRLVSRFLLVALLAPAFTPVFAAEDKPAPAKPTLKLDASPVGEGSSKLVTSYADIVEPLQKAVVSVYSTKIVRERAQVNPMFRQFFGDQLPERKSKEEGLGSGVIVSANGYILTNNHVVADADELKVLLSDGREFMAKVIGTDEKTDVAVIKIDVDNLPVATLADSDKLRVGDIVFAVGNPLGVGQTVTMGIVSATGRTDLGLLENVGGYENFIQTDAAINMGNSGGALIDAKGRLIGINTAIVSPSRGNSGIGFAIPVNQAASALHGLVDTGKVQRGYLGVTLDVEPFTSEKAEALGLKREAKGVLVTDVSRDGPAAKAGVKRNDVITKINDRVVSSRQDMRVLIAQMMPGSEVNVLVFRDGKELTLKVTLGTFSEAETPTSLLPGVTLTPLDDAQRKRLNLDDRVEGALLITEVAPDSPLADRLAPNMVIVEINRRPVADLKAAKAQMRPGLNLFLVYYRGALSYVAITMK
jgi:Do/DeqQ family serine protease